MKQFYFISNNQLCAVKKNDIFKGVGVSNLDLYLDAHPDEANADGFYELSDSTVPEFNPETQTISVSYVVQDNKIATLYSISDI